MWPRLIETPWFSIPSFGALVTLGFIAGVLLAARLARRRGLPADAFLEVANVVLIAGIAGARLLFVALNWREYATRPGEIVAFWHGGMSFHGGLIAGVAAGVWQLRRRGLPVLAMADAAAPAIAVGYAIGRVGCLLNGCCYGGPTDLPWGVPGVYFPGADPQEHYHPAQAYAAILNLALAALLVAAHGRPHRAGQVIALYAAGYSVYRFGIESLRKGVTAHVLALGLTEAQVFSILCLAAATAWWWWLGRPAVGSTKPERAVPMDPTAVGR